MAAPSEEPDYYALLSIAPDSSPQQIRNAYLTLALRHHPDKSHDPSSSETFNLVRPSSLRENNLSELMIEQVKTAYDALSNEQSKKLYDIRHKNARRRRNREASSATEREELQHREKQIVRREDLVAAYESEKAKKARGEEEEREDDDEDGEKMAADEDNASETDDESWKGDEDGRANGHAPKMLVELATRLARHALGMERKVRKNLPH